MKTMSESSLDSLGVAEHRTGSEPRIGSHRAYGASAHQHATVSTFESLDQFYIRCKQCYKKKSFLTYQAFPMLAMERSAEM